MGGSIGNGLKSVFSNTNDEVTGTGQTVGELKNDGYSDKDVSTLGTSPGFGTSLARGLVSGALKGYGNDLQRRRPYQSNFYGGSGNSMSGGTGSTGF